ncbi:Hypothetical_protein [Hexamita inflata]|uniref:Hypothetical_protein n=1 Tax=Hexamita inflata TaxID=28002 RepID=A0AA86V5Q1_9EUKA|nr:Hypothetical protein HINF_LOCUS64907 [Hexamita inflata]
MQLLDIKKMLNHTQQIHQSCYINEEAESLRLETKMKTILINWKLSSTSIIKKYIMRAHNNFVSNILYQVQLKSSGFTQNSENSNQKHNINLTDDTQQKDQLNNTTSIQAPEIMEPDGEQNIIEIPQYIEDGVEEVAKEETKEYDIKE